MTGNQFPREVMAQPGDGLNEPGAQAIGMANRVLGYGEQDENVSLQFHVALEEKAA
jgi:hypothetical protein